MRDERLMEDMGICGSDSRDSSRTQDRYDRKQKTAHESGCAACRLNFACGYFSLYKLVLTKHAQRPQRRESFSL